MRTISYRLKSNQYQIELLEPSDRKGPPTQALHITSDNPENPLYGESVTIEIDLDLRALLREVA